MPDEMTSGQDLGPAPRAAAPLHPSQSGSALHSPLPLVAADLRAARQLLRSVRRIWLVEIELHPDGVGCVVHGTNHRLPFRRPVRLSTALGLIELGVRVVVHELTDR